MIDQLHQLYIEGYNDNEIAFRLKVTREAVRSKRIRLRLVMPFAKREQKKDDA